MKSPLNHALLYLLLPLVQSRPISLATNSLQQSVQEDDGPTLDLEIRRLNMYSLAANTIKKPDTLHRRLSTSLYHENNLLSRASDPPYPLPEDPYINLADNDEPGPEEVELTKRGATFVSEGDDDGGPPSTRRSAHDPSQPGSDRPTLPASEPNPKDELPSPDTDVLPLPSMDRRSSDEPEPSGVDVLVGFVRRAAQIEPSPDDEIEHGAI